jgi:hypothetical protein
VAAQIAPNLGGAYIKSICVRGGAAERKVSGQRKYTNIVLKRGADTAR